MTGRIVVLLLTLVMFKLETKAQTTLNPGDIAVLAVNANLSSNSSDPLNSKDEISFVCFKDILPGTEIQIVDVGYESCVSGQWSGSEGGAKFTRTGATIPAGTVITFRNTSPSYTFIFPDNSWTVTDLFVHPTDPSYSILADNFNIGVGGDQIYFAQGGTWAEQSTLCTINGPRVSPNAIFPGNNGRLIFAYSTSSNWQSNQASSGESGLYPGMTCFSMTAPSNNGYLKYSGPLTAATQAAWITRIKTLSNWTSYTLANYYTSGTNYSVGFTLPITAGGGIPTATWTPPVTNLCTDGASINLNSFVTGSTGGAWSGTAVSGNTFTPTGLNGAYDITYTVNYVSGVNTCPIKQTSPINVLYVSPPTVSSPVNYCGNNSSTALPLSASGSNLLWYPAFTGGAGNSTAPTPSTSIIGAAYYFTSQTVSGCESLRSFIKVNVFGVPTINPANDQTVCTGTITSPIALSGTGSPTFSWTNNTPSIGLAASGTGNVPAFFASNASNAPVTATITATALPTAYAYVANFGQPTGTNPSTVSVINTRTNTIAATIPVGIRPYGVSVSPDGSKAFVSNSGSNTVSVISTATNTVSATIPVGTTPLGLIVSPDGQKLYVASGINDVNVISTVTNTIIGTISTGIPTTTCLSINADGSKLYVVSQSSGNVSVINTATNTVTTTISVGLQPIGIAQSNDGNFLYVANSTSNTVSVINTNTNTVTSTIPVGVNPTGCAVNVDGSKLYVTNQLGNSISIINTSTNTVTGTITGVNRPQGISFTFDGNKAYVANSFGNSVAVINTATNTVSTTVFTGITPRSLGNFITPSIDCSSPPTTATITVYPKPATPATTITQPSCSSPTGSITVTVPIGTGLQYSIDGVNYTNTTGIFTGLAPASYSVTVKNAGNCISAASTAVIFASTGQPSVPSTSITQPSCSVSTGSITVLSPTGSGFTYSIDGINFQSSTSFTNLSANNYVVTVKDGSGCLNTNTATINTAPSPVSSPVVSIIQPTCSAPTGSINVTSPTGTGLTYSVDGLNFQSSTTFTNLSPNTYTVTVSNSSGCSNTAGAVINTPPTTMASPVTSVTQPTCTVAVGSINVTSPTGSSINYSIDGINFQASTLFSNLSPNTYIITAKNTTSGCISTANVTITSTANVAAPIISTTQPTCTTATGSITVTTPTGTGLTYSIDGTNFQSSTLFSNLAPNTYTVTVKNASGCINSTSTMLTAVTGVTAPILSVTQPSCTSATGSITVSSPTGTGLTYSIDGINFQSSPTFNALVPNNYTVTAKNSSGCTNTASTTIIASFTMPVPTFSITQPTCTQPTGSVSIISPIGNTFEYSIDGTNFSFTGTFSGLVPNTYTMTVRNQGGCSNTAPFTINIVPATPAAPTVTTPVTYCQNATATALTANGTNLLWYSSASSLSGSSTAPIPPTNNVGSTPYYVSQSISGCESPRAIINVDVVGSPTVPTIIANGTTSFCEGKDVSLSSSASSNNQWHINGTAIPGATGNTFTANQPGSYTVTVTNANNCSSTSTATTVTVFPNPIVSAGTDLLVFSADSARLQGSASVGNAFTYLWSPSIYLSSTSIAQPWVVYPLNDIIYKLTVTNENGCSNDDEVSVKVLKELIIPNAFSPNGDTVNDTWEITGLGDYSGCIVEVFNRAGQIVYQSFGYSKPWNGTYKGKPIPIGVYYYIINPRNGRPVKSGSVTLLR